MEEILFNLKRKVTDDEKKTLNDLNDDAQDRMAKLVRILIQEYNEITSPPEDIYLQIHNSNKECVLYRLLSLKTLKSILNMELRFSKAGNEIVPTLQIEGKFVSIRDKMNKTNEYLLGMTK